MANQSNDGQERTEQPTAKRLREAREEGQVARSRELTTTLMMLASSAALLLLGDGLGAGVTGILADGLTLTAEEALAPEAMLARLAAQVRAALLTLAPLFALLAVVAVVAPLLLGGWAFSLKSLAFKWEKLDPVKGLGRIFGVRGAVEMAKALAKFMLVTAVAVLLLWGLTWELLGLARESIDQGLVHAMRIFARAFLVLSAALIVIALIDVPYQLWENARRLRMTRQEVKDELKETDGRPEVRSRIRQLQRQFAEGRMLAAVPRADVVVTNPTHYAVALRYESTGRVAAPRVVAKGRDLIAQQIRKVAVAHEVPLLTAPPLARALYATTELEQQIPEALYLAVAQVLAYVYRLDEARRNGDVVPAPPGDLPVPEALDPAAQDGRA